MAILERKNNFQTPLTLTSSELYLDYNTFENDNIYNNTERNRSSKKASSVLSISNCNLNEKYDQNRFYKNVLLPKPFSSAMLDTGTDSVIEYSIASTKNKNIDLSKFDRPDCVTTELTIDKIINDTYALLEREQTSSTYADMLLVSLIAFVRINKNLESMKHENVMFEAQDLDSILKILTIIPTGQSYDTFDKYVCHVIKINQKRRLGLPSSTEADDLSIDSIVEQLQGESYLPHMLIDSIDSYKNEKTAQIRYCKVLNILFSTIGIELSKIFSTVMNIIFLHGSHETMVEFESIMGYLEMILRVSIESNNCEMLIGVEDTIVAWYNTNASIENKRSFNNWIIKTLQELISTYNRDANESITIGSMISSVTDDTDLKLNKCDIVQEFLNSLQLRCSENVTATTQKNFFALSILEPNETLVTVSMITEEEDEEADVVVPMRVDTTVTVSEESSFNRWRHWVHNKLKSVCFHCGRCEEIDNIQHFVNRITYDNRHCIFSDLNVPQLSTIEEPTEMERQYKQLLYDENKGSRKRDVIKLLFK
ncbi:hypothetical protein TPHA_0F01010 [Tetrapisispora phaffii CBS 4417]|uniref:Uncharacterized protein n=1 Tax=Tetrapisispora phaffii (strain ATCC 24235 / CBS 4417 / NBRC 1672 / NRRL Y-8282 / UCD 70-5) TaxID=1071381 RepID=G8BV05_TETPH|nr:hypothetical protein TPHA_0F01010 [Tetrapisispora phaffii CBS 4417]CCE63587.1 hypothetical protein TPHA_0F01010 [Tetrapisispora phaffii CBS 4417]